MPTFTLFLCLSRALLRAFSLTAQRVPAQLHGEPVTAMAVARDGRLLVTGGADSRISFATVSWGGEGSGGQQSACSIKLKRSETLQRPGINHVGVRPDGRWAGDLLSSCLAGRPVGKGSQTGIHGRGIVSAGSS